MNRKLNEEFFHRDCLTVAPELVGKVLVRRLDDGRVIRKPIEARRTLPATPQRDALRGQSCYTAGAA